MIKVIWLIKRKAGVTPQEFRERYERHSRLGNSLVGHLKVSYKRNYKTEVWGGGTPTTPDAQSDWGPIDWPWDVITESVYRDQAAWDEAYRILREPRTAKLFHDDEEDFFDREASILFKCDEVDTGLR
jgi:hypothetical protein